MILPNTSGKRTKFNDVPMKGRYYNYDWLSTIPKKGLAIINATNGINPNHVRRAVRYAAIASGQPRTVSVVDNAVVVW